jgi:hypothetical protein
METNMKTAGVFIDDWKLPVFKRHLDKAGYNYEVRPGLTEDTLKLMVKFEWVSKLQPVIEAANEECAKQGGPQNQTTDT